MTYREELESAIVKRFGYAARYVETTEIEEVFQGRGHWKGTVCTYALPDHPFAKHCYAWGEKTPKGTWNVTTVLETPPISSAETAVRAGFSRKI